jgi:hypothetical protein
MRKFLEEKWDCEIDYLSDKKIDLIEDKFKELSNFAKYAQSFHQAAFLFVYYSGHGTIRGKETVGHTVNYEPIMIESHIRKLARRTNCFVVGFFDCCRMEEGIKGNARIEKPING